MVSQMYIPETQNPEDDGGRVSRVGQLLAASVVWKLQRHISLQPCVCGIAVYQLSI